MAIRRVDIRRVHLIGNYITPILIFLFFLFVSSSNGLQPNSDSLQPDPDDQISLVCLVCHFGTPT